MTVIPLPKIRCAVCGRPADRVVLFRDDQDMSQRLRAYCHGERDEMTLTDHELANWTRDELRQMTEQTGVAFARAALPTPPPEGKE